MPRSLSIGECRSLRRTVTSTTRSPEGRPPFWADSGLEQVADEVEVILEGHGPDCLAEQVAGAAQKPHLPATSRPGA